MFVYVRACVCVHVCVGVCVHACVRARARTHLCLPVCLSVHLVTGHAQGSCHVCWCCSVLQCVAVCHSVFQYGEVCCSVLQCVAMGAVVC